MQHPKGDAIASDGGAQLDRDADESEGDRSFPDRRHSRHSTLKVDTIGT
jgi:hypothetical protein